MMRVIQKPISLAELKTVAEERFGDLVKAVVDIKQGIMAIGGELHADEEVLLTDEHGSKREDVWGINLYPAADDTGFLEFDSMINLKPSLGNRSRDVEDPEMRKKIRTVVEKLVVKK